MLDERFVTGLLALQESRLLQDIRNQPKSLDRVLAHQFGEGFGVLAEAAQGIRASSKVVLTGMGASFAAAEVLHYQLVSRGLNCHLVETAELLHYQQPLCSDATVVLVSRSGESVELRKLLPHLKGASRRTIAVTNNRESTLALQADLTVFVNHLPDDQMAIQSYTGTLLALLILAATVNREEKEAHGALPKILEMVPEVIDRGLSQPSPWNQFLMTKLPVVLLGRGPSRASAREGALLFHEIAKHTALGMAAGSFRHGSVESVDDLFRGIVFAPHGKTHGLSVALASELERLMGKVLVVGPTDLSGRLTFLEIPAVPEPFAPLLEILTVQIGALRLAELKGLPVGALRYISQVTEDEARF